MKKLFFTLTAFLLTLSLWAADVTLTEEFTNVIQTSSSGTAGSNWTGDVCGWTTKYARRGTNDLINGAQATWITLDATTRGFIKTTNLEGGIKAVSFKYAQFGAEAANTLRWQVSAVPVSPASPISDVAERDGSKGANKDKPDTYSHTFSCKQNAQLEILNMSVVTTSGAQPASNARLLVGDIIITPYLLYTTKKVEFQVTGASNTFTNTDLINNIDEGDVVYSISENTIGATINATTGEVTATEAGEVTVTATWEGVTTSYTLTILTKKAATAAFEKEAYLVKINETAPVNVFTTNSTATVEYSSSVESVATVDPATGAITLVGEGTTVITATVPENDDYTAAEASYKIRVVPENWKIETFESAAETTSNYANPAESTTGDLCQWTAQLGGVKHMTDAGYTPMFGDTKYALFRAPRQGETKVSYIESDPIEGGISSLTFSANPTASEGTTTWDIRVFINDVQVGDNYSNFPASPQTEWTTITIPNINVDGEFVIRFENHSTISGTYTSGNKGRLAIDNIEIVGYETYAVTFNGMPSHGLLGVLNGSSPLTSGDKVPEGTVLTIVPTPGTGYEVNTLTVMNGETPVTVENNQFTMPAGNVTVSATFSLIDYTVTHNAATNGSYTIKVDDAEAVSTNTTANYGQTVTLAAEADYGYEFSEWTVMNGETPVAVDENNQFTMPAGNVTVSATFAALPVKYYIAGDFTSWAENKIPVYADSYTIQGLSAAAHLLKVIDGETWKGYSDLTAPEMVAGLYGNNDNNICFTLAEAGAVTVTYTNEVFKLAGGFVPQTVRVKGAWDDWATTHVMNISDDRKSASITMELPAADEVQFGIDINGDDYRANGYGFKRDYNSESGISGFSANMKLTSDKAGDYTFTWTFGTNTLEITFPEILVYRVAGDEALMGSDWNTGDDNNAMTLDEGIYSLTKISVTLQANTYKFKVVADDTWRIAYPADNAELVIDPRGTYDVKFTFNPTTKAVGAEATYKGPVTSIDNTNVNTKAEKQLINGQLIIIKNGVRYNAQGQVL